MDLYRAIIRRFDPGAWQADVELIGAPAGLLAGVPVAAGLGPALLPAGAKVWVALGSAGSPAAGLVLAPYGQPPAPWVSSRLLRPTIVTAEQIALTGCTATSFVNVDGLSLTLTLETAGAALLLLAATGHISSSGVSYTLACYHDDGHETTQLTPVETVGGPGAAVDETWGLTWLGLQSGIAAGEHTFVLKHRVSSGQAVLERARLVAVAVGA